MDNDPKSYRVPIVHLSDMFKKTSGGDSDDKKDAEKNTGEKIPIREEDIQAAVIIPSTPPSSSKGSEKPLVVETPEEVEVQQYSSQAKDVNFIQEEKSSLDFSPQPPSEIEGLLVSVDEDRDERPLTALETQEVKIEEEPFNVDKELPLNPSISPFKEVDTVEQAETPKISPPEERGVESYSPQETKPDEDEIQKLINENLLVSAATQENTGTEKISTPVEQNLLDLSQSAVLPTADPLDIWERDALRHEKEQPKQTLSTPRETVPEEEPSMKMSVQTPKPEPTQQETPNTFVQEKIVSEKNTFEEPVPLVKKTPTEQAPTPKVQEKKTDGAGNLDALRKRVLKEGTAIPSSQPIIHPLRVEDAILVKEIDENRPKPTTKHASAIAGVADRLQNITQEQGYDFNAPSSIEKTTETQSESAITGIDTTRNTPSNAVPGKVAPGSLEQPVQVNTVPKSSIPLIRTFKADVEQAVMRDRTSIVDMVSAEEKRRGLGETVRMAPRPKTSMFSRFLIITSIIMVFVGLGIGGYILFRLLTIDRDTSVIIPVSETTEYDITGQSGKKLLEGLTKLKETMDTDIGSVTELHFIERFDDERGVGIDSVQPSYFFERLETRAPGMLIRTLTDTMTFGFHSLQKNEPFWIFPINHYAVSFRGMLEWEDSMREDLAPLFTELPKTTSSTSPTTSEEVTTASSTTPTPPQENTPPRLQFEDIVIANKEARGLKDENGKIILLWTVPDSKTVVITTNKTTAEMLIGRMSARFSE